MRRAFALLATTTWLAACQPEHSPVMRPGDNCQRCHSDTGNARRWTLAGTVYQFPRDAADQGTQGVRVTITDSAGRRITLASNGAGNFYSAEGLVPPFAAQVEYAGRTSTMLQPQAGTCNGCHTLPPQSGAPGRIYWGGGTPQPGTHDGLPCDVANLLQNRCDSCHSNPPAGSAPMALVSYADLMKPAPSDSAKTAAQKSLERMNSASSPMPPGGQLPASEIAVLQNWLDAGAPQGSCSTQVDPPVCTSNTYYQSGGEEGSSLMNPGMACLACHAQGEGPSFTIAGTVYPTFHEPDLCDGAVGPSVVVTDAHGSVLTLRSNGAGNFYTGKAVSFPVSVKVTSSGATRQMSASPSSGDCNACHTQDGANGAPGRIKMP
ncbi:MAG: hypothetical protein QM765_35285 [Myxococcales bacterium]